MYPGGSRPALIACTGGNGITEDKKSNKVEKAHEYKAGISVPWQPVSL